MPSHTDTNRDFDVIVIGAGPAGENAADIAGRDGLRVAIVESELVGGECSYWGCMPSKALLRPGEALDEVGRVPGARGAVTGTVDLEEALDRRDAFTSNWDDAGQVDWLESAGIELLRGRGRLVGERVVDVERADGSVDRFQAARAVVLATGTRAARPPIPGLDTVRAWDNRDISEAKAVPRRLLVIGGGAIGVEMAQAWKWLGSEEVTLVEAADRLLPQEEPFVGTELRSSLERAGITVFTGVMVESLQRQGSDGPVSVSIANTSSIETDEVLVATGRVPNTDDVGLASVGLESGGFVDVDDRLVVTGVTGDWLYAVGDVNGRALFTHSGKYQARIAGAHIRGRDTTAFGDRRANPRVVFTSPEIAAVGLTEEEAHESGMDVRTATYDIGHVAAASILGKGYRGTAKLVVDAERSVVVGATFVGPRAGELVHAATIAIVGEVPLAKLWHAVPAFPTLSEVWLRLLEAYRDDYGVEFA